ncbi:hypothetical protein CO659_31075 [Rhizobium sp. S9]|nr:hypothetical protein CO659_31075 [Rhizobium sp. S9]
MPEEPQLKVVSGVIQDYPSFVRAMVSRLRDLKLPCIELDARSGMQEGYANKLEKWVRATAGELGLRSSLSGLAPLTSESCWWICRAGGSLPLSLDAARLT